MIKKQLAIVLMALMLVALTVPATSAGKGLAVTPETGKTSPAVITTKKVNQYFKDALGSSTLLIGKKAKKNTVLKQLKYNRKLIAWNYIGGGNDTSLFMYDGNLTSDDFYSMNRWRGLKDCVCFVGSNESYESVLMYSILGNYGKGVGPGEPGDHGVRTYIGCTVAVPIATHANVSEEFWNLTLLQCYTMGDALNESTDNFNVSGDYGIWGDTGTFFPPLKIKTIVSPGSCVVRQGRTMRITAKSDRYVFKGTRVELYINGVLEDSTTISSKKTKLLLNYKWTNSSLFDPGLYRIDIYVYSSGGKLCGEDHKWFAVVPKNGKLEFSADANESVDGTEGNASGWIRPTRCRTRLQSCMLAGTYNVVMEYNSSGRTMRDRYAGKCALLYYPPGAMVAYGSGSNHWTELTGNESDNFKGYILDSKRMKFWTITNVTGAMHMMTKGM